MPVTKALGATVILNASEFSALDNGEFLDFGFYDQEQTYGFGFTRVHGETQIEIMVADQSIYDLIEATICFKPDEFSIVFPKGTIKPVDGDDEYHIRYELLSPEKYENALALLRNLLKGQSNVELECS